jgi:alkylated DNA nucleotide flippase Atl1
MPQTEAIDVSASSKQRKVHPAAAEIKRNVVARTMEDCVKCATYGKPLTYRQLAHITGHSFRGLELFLNRCAFIPWVKVVTVAPDGHLAACDFDPRERLCQYQFSIDEELRNICEARVPRPALGQRSIFECLASLRKEITRLRKEAGDRREARNWNPEPILKHEQTKVLNYIEAELDKLIS